jgi:preprotein translocase subunit YajC
MDPLTIGLFALLAVMIFFMFRNSRKRQREAEALRSKMVPGVEVMTQHGIYGLLISLDQEKNEAVIETTPGTRLRVHSQTLAKVVEDDALVADDAETPADGELERADVDPADRPEPEFGERIDDADQPKRDKSE